MPTLSDRLAQRFPLLHDLVTVRLTSTLVTLALVFAVAAYGAYAQLIIESDGLLTRYANLIGGDFVVFRTAGELAGAGAIGPIYRIDYLSSHLRSTYPGAGAMIFGWFYPPTMFLVVAPLGLLPYMAGLCCWLGAQLALFAGTLRSIWSDRNVMILSLASPAVVHSVITGQTGMLTGSLLALSAYFAQSRPLVAGIAAGMLTVKPQLGLLIPIAFIAGRCWKAIAYASAVTLLLATIALVGYGTESWIAFGTAMLSHAERMQTAGFPIGKLITPYGAVRLVGGTPSAAAAAQLVATVLMALYVFLAWWRRLPVELRLAALLSATPLATPYAFYYELAIFVFPVAMIARDAQRSGWLRWERMSLIALWIGAFLPPGGDAIPSVPVAFLVALAAWLVCARRIVPALLDRRLA